MLNIVKNEEEVEIHKIVPTYFPFFSFIIVRFSMYSTTQLKMKEKRTNFNLNISFCHDIYVSVR